MIKLNLGCQVHYFDGWVNQDIVGYDPNIPADLVCDAAQLPYEDNSVDFIYAGHLVEHYYPNTLGAAIAEWNRVLKPGGRLVITTPDCGAVFRDYAAGKLNMEETWQQIYGRIYDYDAAPERHHIAFDSQTLWKMASDYPWTMKYEMNFGINEPSPVGVGVPEELVPFMDVHISRGAYQIGLVLTK